MKNDSTEEKKLASAVLVFLVKKDATTGKIKELLLARKLKKIGAGRLNGYGGGFKPVDQSLHEKAAIRELEEECGVTASPDDLERVAKLVIRNTTTDGQSFTCVVFVFLLRTWTGEPIATKEMDTPVWYTVDALPFDELMPADRIWLPQVLAGHKLLVAADYGPFQQKLKSSVISIQALSEIELE